MCAYVTDSALGAAQRPVEEYVARWVEGPPAIATDGRKLEVLRECVRDGDGALHVSRTADPQDYGQPLTPRVMLPVAFTCPASRGSSSTPSTSARSLSSSTGSDCIRCVYRRSVNAGSVWPICSIT